MRRAGPDEEASCFQLPPRTGDAELGLEKELASGGVWRGDRSAGDAGRLIGGRDSKEPLEVVDAFLMLSAIIARQDNSVREVVREQFDFQRLAYVASGKERSEGNRRWGAYLCTLLSGHGWSYGKGSLEVNSQGVSGFAA